jgi:DNA-binding NtrC family response regulator
LRAYQWPGNVRELQNCMERAVILSDGDTIHARHLNIAFKPPAVPAPVSPWEQIDLSGTMPEALCRVTVEVERRKIAAALVEFSGDKARAASALQIGYKALLHKIREYALEA